MDKEGLKAVVDGLSEEAEVEFEQGIEEKELKTIITEEVIALFEDTIRLARVLLATSSQQNICAPAEEHITLFLIVSIAHKALPHDLNLLWLQEFLWRLSDKESQEIKSFTHLLRKCIIVDSVCDHCIEETPIIAHTSSNCS